MTKGDAVRALICPHCGRPSAAAVRGTAIWHGYGADGQPQNPPVEYALVQCDQCGDVSLQAREDYGRGFDEDDPAFLYPAPRRLNWIIPDELRREWEEARTCLDAKAYAACMVMVRRTVEGTCKEQGVTGKTLAESLRKLRDAQLIDGMLAEWADTLRVAGNLGAHFTGKAVPRQDAEDALAFAEALLDHLYVMRKRFEEFKRRLDTSQKTAKKSVRKKAGAAP